MYSLSEFYEQVMKGQWKGSIEFSNDQDVCGYSALGTLLSNTYKKLVDNGVTHSDRVIVNASSTIETISVMISLWKIGAVVIPVKPGVNYSDIQNDSGAKYFVDEDNVKTLSLNNTISSKSRFVINTERTVTGVDLALIIYTSGSTGLAKGIMLSHANVITAIESVSEYLSITDSDRILCTSPLSFDYGLYQLLFSLYKHASIIIYQGMMQPIKLVKVLSNSDISIFPVVPATAVILEKGLNVASVSLPNLRMITNTGGHLMQRCISAYQIKIPHVSIVPMYGLTESKRALYLPPGMTSEKLGSVGIPMPGLEAKLFREVVENDFTEIHEVAIGEVGELFVRGSTVMQGYVTDHGTGAVLHRGDYRDDNWLSTGDLFKQDSDGYFYFVGRSKELIKQFGYCLYPHEIEDLLMKSNLVDLAVVVLDYDQLEQEMAHAIIKLKQGESSENFRSWVLENTDRDYRPNKISYVDEFIFTPNGKPDKKSLLEKIRENT